METIVEKQSPNKKSIEAAYIVKTICTRCIYDSNIPYITFDETGVCNYCLQYDELNQLYPTGDQGTAYLKSLAEQIKRSKNKKYDVVVGVSGGTDSSYMMYPARKFWDSGYWLHFDNTWNSKIAVENIHV